MCHRLLPASQRVRRDIIFAGVYDSIVLLTDEVRRARNVPADDPELTIGDLSVDAVLGAAEDYEALYWRTPDAFAARLDAELAEFILVRAACAIDREIERALAQRAPIDDEPTTPILGRGRRTATHNLGYSIIEAV